MLAGVVKCFFMFVVYLSFVVSFDISGRDTFKKC